MSVVDDSFGHPLKQEEKATMILAGGIATQGYQCGMLWGAALAAGAQAYRLFGSGAHAETAAIIASQRALEAFRTRSKNEINCLEITELNFQGNNQILPILKFIAKGGPVGCFRMAARYAPIAYSEIDSALSNVHDEIPSPPISCTTMLAIKMDVSEMHAVMAAGLAGGIGLSGGACGVLGAAIWIHGMNQTDEPVGFNFTEGWVGDIIEGFLESSDYQFECSEIVGRKFENVGDHADYLRLGGCSKLIDAIAAYEV
ncbi:hypothetical protein ACFLXB_07785 [Chloroflexota bacterium]